MRDKIADVVFLRGSDDDEVFAIFPFLPATVYLITCYDHVAQHSGASLWYCDGCKEITDPVVYADLHTELTRIGYQLRVVRKDCLNNSEHVTACR